MGEWLKRLVGGGGGVAKPRHGKGSPADEGSASPEGEFLRSRMRAHLAQEPGLGRLAAFERAKPELLAEIRRQGGPDATLLAPAKRGTLPLEGCFDLPVFTLEETLRAEERLARMGATDADTTFEVYTEVVQELAQQAPPAQGFSTTDVASFSADGAAAQVSGPALEGGRPAPGTPGVPPSTGRSVYDVTAESDVPVGPGRK